MNVIGRIAQELTPEVQRGMFESLKKPEVQKEARSWTPFIIRRFTGGGGSSPNLSGVNFPAKSGGTLGGSAPTALGILCLFSTWYFSNDIRKQLPMINRKIDQMNEKIQENEGRMAQLMVQREEEIRRFFSAIDRATELQGVLALVHASQQQLIERQNQISTRHLVYVLALQGELQRQNQTILGFQSLFEEMKKLLQEAIERREQIDEDVRGRLNAAERHYDALLGGL